MKRGDSTLKDDPVFNLINSVSKIPRVSDCRHGDDQFNPDYTVPLANDVVPIVTVLHLVYEVCSQLYLMCISTNHQCIF